MKPLYIVVLMVIVFGLGESKKKSNCRCPKNEATQSLCASDGNIYSSECQAKCGRPSIKILFNCSEKVDSGEETNCKEKCRSLSSECKEGKECNPRPVPKPTCESKCPIFVHFNRICASNGRSYMDLCRARCSDKSLTELFNCNLMSIEDCDDKCKKAFDDKKVCEGKCPAKKWQRKICASDGNLYADQCRAKCSNSQLAQVFKCNRLKDQKCKTKCEPEAKISDCQKACPVKEGPQLNLCFGNGKVYSDYCQAVCVDPEIKLFFDCEDRGMAARDKVKCENVCMKEVFCVKKCDKRPKKFVCASDRKIYNNKCEALCKGLDILFFLKRKNEHQENNCQNAKSLIGSTKR